MQEQIIRTQNVDHTSVEVPKDIISKVAKELKNQKSPGPATRCLSLENKKLYYLIPFSITNSYKTNGKIVWLYLYLIIVT